MEKRLGDESGLMGPTPQFSAGGLTQQLLEIQEVLRTTKKVLDIALETVSFSLRTLNHPTLSSVDSIDIQTPLKALESKTSSLLRVREEGSMRGETKRGSRLDENWRPSAADCEYARSLGLDVEATLEEFKDYWLAKAGPGAVKLDWGRTFRRWCRTAVEFSRLPKRAGRVVDLAESEAELIRNAARHARRFGGLGQED